MGKWNVRDFKEEKTWTVNKYKRSWSNVPVLKALQIETGYSFSIHHTGEILSFIMTSMSENEGKSLAGGNVHWWTYFGEQFSSISNKIENWYSNFI